jgi:AcrR family transcriptional regulator
MAKRAQPRSGRRYDASGRRARAESTKAEVVAVAHQLFVARGYHATTVADVAEAANVSQPTVYAGFGTKAGLLKACIDAALAGDTSRTAVADRPLAQWVQEADDPREMLGRYATMMGTLAKRAGPIFDVLVRAADADDELKALLADFERQRLRAAGMVAEAIAERGGMPSGRTAALVRDVIWVLNAPELYTTLTRKRGWSQRQYVTWARDSLVKLVLEPPEPGAVPKP